MRALNRTPKKNPPKRSNDKKSSSAKSHSWFLLTIPIFIAIIAGIFLRPGLLLYLSTLANFAFTLAATYITQKKDSRPIVKHFAPALVAAIPTLVSGTVEKYLEINSKPTFTIETKLEDQQAIINLKILTGRPTRFSIDYPVQGMITRIKEVNPITDVRTTIKPNENRPEGVYLDNAELTIEDIKLNTNLQYIILFKPVTIPNLVLHEHARGIYTITYEWQYKDEKYSKTEWLFVKNDKITDTRFVEARDVTFTDEIVSAR